MEHQEVTELFLLRQVPQAKHQSGSKPVSVCSYLRIDIVLYSVIYLCSDTLRL